LPKFGNRSAPASFGNIGRDRKRRSDKLVAALGSPRSAEAACQCHSFYSNLARGLVYP